MCFNRLMNNKHHQLLRCCETCIFVALPHYYVSLYPVLLLLMNETAFMFPFSKIRRFAVVHAYHAELLVSKLVVSWLFWWKVTFGEASHRYFGVDF